MSELLEELRTAVNKSYPGFIYNFDTDSQTAEVQLAIEELSIGIDSSYQVTKKDRLIDVLVQVIRGGSWSLRFPIPDGTPCYVEFSQRGIEHWLMEGKCRIDQRLACTIV